MPFSLLQAWAGTDCFRVTAFPQPLHYLIFPVTFTQTYLLAGRSGLRTWWWRCGWVHLCWRAFLRMFGLPRELPSLGCEDGWCTCLVFLIQPPSSVTLLALKASEGFKRRGSASFFASSTILVKKALFIIFSLHSLCLLKFLFLEVLPSLGMMMVTRVVSKVASYKAI